jgi:integrase
VRDIPLEPPLVAALRRWKLQCPPTSTDLVFPAPSGLPFHESTALRQGLYPAWKRAELPRFSLYALRHCFASFLILKGAAVTEVAHLLGHSDPTVTLRRYARWFRQAKSEAMGALARAVCGEA